jgi:methylthioribose-1-phosphate isomerase
MSQNFLIVDWQDDFVVLLDQRKLPREESYLRFDSVEGIAEAIKNMTVRGAPAIGVTAAFGMALAAIQSQAAQFEDFSLEMNAAANFLRSTRPTAVNLAWGLNRMLDFMAANRDIPLPELKTALVQQAKLIKEEDVTANRKLGKFGQALIADGDTILTHCNAGALATAGYGTALGVIYAAASHGKKIRVFSDETRPLLQGARLTAWELERNGIDVTVIADNMAGHFMQRGEIQKVIVGADRIAANGDTANKIGTYPLAIAAHYHRIPFYVAAPVSTIDFKTATGTGIPIEERDACEITSWNGLRTTPERVPVKNPAFDVTPHHLISAIITEKGVVLPPFSETLRKITGNLVKS